MASRTLKRMEAALAKVVVKPHTEVLEELKGIARSDPENPAPLLAMAIVSGVYGMSRMDFDEMEQHLGAAAELVKGLRGRDDAESKFSVQLNSALKTELYVAEKTEIPGKRLTVEQRERIVKRSIAGQKAIRALGQLVRQIEGSTLPGVIHSALRALSLTTGKAGRDYRLGMSKLSAMFKGEAATRDLAGFFMVYGYRRKRRYPQAIQVCKTLERRNPRSPLPKKMLATAHYYRGEMETARSFYEKALALAPAKDPRGLVCYSRILERLGATDEASEVLAKAQELDREGRVAPILAKEVGRVEIQKSLKPELRKIGLA